MAKKIVVDTDLKKGKLFRVSESSGRFYIYDVSVGFFTDSKKKIGESRSLEDAITLIKASVTGSIRNLRIEEW